MSREYYYNSSKKITNVYPCRYQIKTEESLPPMNRKIVSMIRENSFDCQINKFDNNVYINFNVKAVVINTDTMCNIFNDLTEDFVRNLASETKRKDFFNFFLDRYLLKNYSEKNSLKVTYVLGSETKTMRCYRKYVESISEKDAIIFYSFSKNIANEYVEVTRYREYCKIKGIEVLEKEKIELPQDESLILRMGHKCLKI